MRILRKIVSFVLCASMLVQMAPACLAESYASAPYETVETERGKTLRDQVIDGNLVMDDSESLYVAGIITMRNGDILVTGGQHEIGRDAVIRGDIVVAGPASLMIDGIVEGELRLEWEPWPVNDERWQQEDLPSHLSVDIGEHAVVSAIRGGGFQGDMYIRGSVTTVEMEDKRSPENLSNRGRISFNGNAFADSIRIRGGAAPEITVGEHVLVNRIELSDCSWLDERSGAWLDTYGGRINELIIKNGVGCNLFGGEIGKIDASGAGVWIAVRDMTIGQVTLSNSNNNRNIQDWYANERTVMAVEKGTTIESVVASGLSSFSISNIAYEAEEFSGQPIASLDRDRLFKETRVGSVVASGPVCLENRAYIESVVLGRGANMWGSGMTERLEATDASMGFSRCCEEGTDLYFNRVCGTYNEEYYHGISVGFASIKGGSADFGAGTGAKTVIAEDTHLHIGQFHQIENLVLNGVRWFRSAEDEQWDEIVTSFEKEERIGRLFFNSGTYSIYSDGLPAMHIGTLSIFNNAMPVFADIDRLLLPNGQKQLSSGLQGSVALGTRPEPLPEATAQEAEEEASEEAPTAEYYVSAVSTTQMKKGGNNKEGGTSRSKAQKLRLESYRICKTSSKDWWYTVETDALQTLNLTLDADEGMGMLVVYGPDDQLETMVSDQGKAELSVVSVKGGVWTLRLIGAQNDYALKLGVSDPIRVEIDATMQPANSKGNGKKTPLDLTAYSLEVENVTQGTHPEFFVTDDGIVMATDQGQRGDKLRITLSDPKDAFIPVSADVWLNYSMQAKARLETAEYGSYTVSCQDASEVYMHLYDKDGAYVMTLSSSAGAYRADKLLPGTYHLVMIRGNVGRWRFSRLSDYAAFGLKEKRDYRLDTFTLRKGYTDSYPGATVPAEPVIDSPYVVEESSRFDAAKSVCLENGSVLMRVEYELENTQEIAECTVEIELNGMDVDPQAVTLNGEPTACTLENNVLRIPVQGQSAGKLAFYAHSTEQKEMLAIGRLRMQTAEGGEFAYLGSVAIERQTLSIYASPESGGAVNLFGYGVPGEALTILRDGAVAAYAQCDMNGQWSRTLHMEATVGYESYAFSAVVYAGTENELISEPVTVRVQQDTPSLTGVELYYYEHEHQRKLSLSAEQFYRGKLSFSYLPGSAFTIKFTFDNPERIEEMDLVLSTKAGDDYVFPCEFNQASGVFTASGEFPKASMSNTLRLNWRLTPLPEPEPLPAFDYEAAEEALRLEVTALDARVEDDYLECDMQITLGGKDLGVSTLRMELTETDYDAERLEEEALMCYDLGADGVAYLMGDEAHPESLYLVYADPASTASLQMSGIDKLLAALIPTAYADEEGGTSVSGQLVSIGTMVAFDVATGIGGTVVEVYAYDTMMIATYQLRNKVDERLQEVLREIGSETNPERLLCLSTLAEMYRELYDDCTRTAQAYADKAKWAGVAGLGSKLIKPETLKSLRELGKSLRNLKQVKNIRKAAADTYRKMAQDLDGSIKDLIELKDLKMNQKRLSYWSTPENRAKLRRAFNIKIRRLIHMRELRSELQKNWDDIKKLGNAIKNQTFGEQEYILFNDLLRRLGGFVENGLDAWGTLETYWPEAMELFNAVKADTQDKLQQEEEALEQIDQQLTNAGMDMAEETTQGMFETMREVADDIRSQFSEDYERLMSQYNFIGEIECPQPSPSPTPTVAPTAAPTTEPEPEPVKPGIDNPPGIEVPIDPIPDPSGYVYEGMWSNRISGVQTTAYTRDAAGAVVQWDAEPYGQKNPTQTNEQGYYEWYVPEGDWMVVYEKEGYESAQSDWMAVPPPQTEVHQNLISYEPPQLVYAKHYGDEVELSFSKPIRVDSVNSQTLSIGTNFAVQAMNPERYGETDIVLATLFRLVPEKKLPGEIQVEISSGVTGYVGVPCEEASVKCARMARLTGIEAPAVLNARAGESVILTIQADGGDFESYHLLVSGAHEDLLRIDSIGGFDASGCAVIEMTPLASGMVLLDISVRDTQIATAVKLVAADQ